MTRKKKHKKCFPWKFNFSFSKTSKKIWYK